MLQPKINGYFDYTPTEPPISPFKPINRLLKTDWYNGTTYNRLAKNSPHYPK